MSGSMFEELVATHKGAVELAAARAQNHLFGLLQDAAIKAFEEGTSSVEKLASDLGVTSERVNQVLLLDDEAEDRMPSSILLYSRYLRALNYELDIRIVPATSGPEFKR